MLAFWGFAVLYFQRINLSIAIVCMVKSSSNVTSELAMGLNSSLAVNTTAGYALASSVSPLTTQAPLQPGDEGYCDALELSKAKDGDIVSLTCSHISRDVLVVHLVCGEYRKLSLKSP